MFQLKTNPKMNSSRIKKIALILVEVFWFVYQQFSTVAKLVTCTNDERVIHA